MLNQIITFLAGIIVTVISDTGYIGIVVLMAIESACVPLPSEIIMPFAGYLVSTGRFSLFWVATAGAIGCNIGSTAAYALGAWGGRPAIEKWGRYLLLDMHDLDLAERFFNRFGSATVFVSRLLPVVRGFISLPAGAGHMNMFKFQIYSFVGSWFWCFVLAYIGMQLGEHWESNPNMGGIFHAVDITVVLVVVLGIGWFVYRRVYRKKREPE